MPRHLERKLFALVKNGTNFVFVIIDLWYVVHLVHNKLGILEIVNIVLFLHIYLECFLLLMIFHVHSEVLALLTSLDFILFFMPL